MFTRIIFAVAVATAALSAQASTHGKAAVEHLTTNGLENPLGTSVEAPEFSWQLDDARPGARQTAYELLVGSSEDKLKSGTADVWDSGKIVSDHSVHVAYAGPALQSQKRYYWLVRAWDKDGNAYPVSTVQWWETGLTDGEWKAQWIASETRRRSEPTTLPLPACMAFA